MKHHFRAGHLAQLGLFVSGIALTCWAVACGSSSPPDPAVTGFDGVYQTENSDGDSADDIGTVAFANGQDYVLMTSACSDASCAEFGTYYYDPVAKTLNFTNSKNGVQRVVPVDVVSTESVADGTVTTQDDTIVTGGNAVVVNGNGNTIVVNQGTAAASASSSALVKRCPPGTTPGGTTTVGKTTSGTTSGGDTKDPNLPKGTTFASLHVQLGVAPLASSATDGCTPLKPTALAKSAKIKTQSGNQKLLNKNQSRLSSGSSGSPGSPGAGTPNNGNTGAGSPGSGIPSLPTNPPPNNGSTNSNAATDRVSFCNQLANQSTTSITARQKQIIFMQCLTAAASQA